MVAGNFFSTFFSYTYKEYGEAKQLHKPISEVTLTWAASIGSGIINGCARLSMGFLQDRISFRVLLGIIMTIQLLVSLIVYWVTEIPALYVMCVFLNYFEIGGLFAIFPGSVTNTFGLKYGPQIYSLILLASLVSSILNIFMTDVVLPWAGYAACFYIGSVVAFLALGILYVFEERLDIENLARVGGIQKVVKGGDKSGTLDESTDQTT